MTVVDLFAIGGQSNAVGAGGDQALSPDLNAGEALEYAYDDSTINNPIDDPVSSNNNDANTGSAWPAFAQTYWQNIDRVSCYVGAANGGTAQHADADGGSGHWDVAQTPNYYSDSVTIINTAITALENAGYTVRFRGVLWHQGERDSGAIDSGTITKTQYKGKLQDMINQFRTDFSSGMPFWIHQVAHETTGGSGDTAGYQAVRAAQAETANEMDGVYMVSDIQKDFPEAGKMSDSIHYNQTGYNEMGTEGATNAVQSLKSDYAKGSIRTVGGAAQTSNGSKEMAIVETDWR